MTEQELREKIADYLFTKALKDQKGEFTSSLESADQILIFIKEAGYISLADVLDFLTKHAYHYEDVRGNKRIRYSIIDRQLEELLRKHTPIIGAKAKWVPQGRNL